MLLLIIFAYKITLIASVGGTQLGSQIRRLQFERQHSPVQWRTKRLPLGAR